VFPRSGEVKVARSFERDGFSVSYLVVHLPSILP
jgi:hypothetical protein